MNKPCKAIKNAKQCIRKGIMVIENIKMYITYISNKNSLIFNKCLLSVWLKVSFSTLNFGNGP